MAWNIPRGPFIGTVPFTAVTSTAVAAPSYGVVTIAGAATAKSWTISAPVAGRSVMVVVLDAAPATTSGSGVQKLLKAGVDFISTDGAKTVLSFNADYDNVALVGLNSTRFLVTARGSITSS